MNIETGNTLTNVKSSGNQAGKSILIAIPALFIFFIFLVLPFINTFILSFKDYSIAKGISGSSWVGSVNYSEFLQSPAAGPIIKNSFFISILSLIFGSIYVFVLTYGIAGIKARWLKALATSLVMLPALIPALLYIPVLSQLKFLLDPSLYRLTAVANEVFSIAPLAVLAGVFACINEFDVKKVWFVTLGYAAVRLILLFSSDLNYILATYNPLVYQTGDVIDTYVYRQGLMNSKFAVIAAAYMVKVLLQLLPAVLGTVTLFITAHKFNHKINNDNNISPSDNSARYLAIASIFPAALFILAIAATIPGNNNSPLFPVSSMANSTLLSIQGCILAGVLGLLLAYGLTVGSKFMLIVNSVFLFIGGNLIGHYLNIRSLGMVNTYWGIVFSYSLYAVIGSFCIYLALGRQTNFSFGSFLSKSLPALIAFIGFGFARFYGSLLEPIIFLSNKRVFPAVLALRQMLIADRSNGPVSYFNTSVSFLVVPAIIGIACVWIGIMSAKKEV